MMWMSDDGWGHMGGWSWGWGVFGMLMMAVFWVAVILLVIYAVRGAALRGGHPSNTHQEQGDRSLSILQERYARGEIDRDEFESRRRTLEDPMHST